MRNLDDHEVAGVALFDPPPVRRRWSAPDLVRLLFASSFLVAAFLAASLADETISGVEEDVVAGIGRLPDRIEATVIGTAQIIATFVPLVAMAVVVWRRRWRILLSFGLASIITSAATSIALRVLGDRASGARSDGSVDGENLLVAADFPTTTYLASAVAVVTIGSAYIPRRWRRAAWSWIVVLLVLRFLGPGQPPLDIWVAVAVGMVVGSVLLLSLGSPNPEPEPATVLHALREVGLDPIEVRRWEDGGSRLIYETHERDGGRTFVKLRTPDDRSWDLLTRLYRGIRLRSSEVARPFSTLKRRVEHEALALWTVRDGGTCCPRVIGVGVTPGGAAFLVEEYVAGTRLADLPNSDFDDDLLRSIFRLVRGVHSTRTAHHNLTLDNMLRGDDGVVWLVDFDEAELAADRRERARDTAELLVAVSLIVGPERTVAIGLDELGREEIAASLPLIQPLALARSLGPSIKRERNLLDRIRNEIHERTGVADVPLEQLARIRPRTLVMIVAATLAFYSLLPQFGNLDETVDAFGDVRWGWMPALLAASVVYFVFATISFLGSVAQPMPIAASVRSQVATAFALLVGPASAGKMALAGRFLQRNGLTPAEASASVALNTVAGVATHLLLMAGFFAWAGGSSVGGLSLPSVGTFVLVGSIVLALIMIAVAIPLVRRTVIRPVIEGLRSAAGYVATVVRSPVRVVALIGGSSLITLTYLLGLVFAVQAFGGGIAIAQIGAAYLGAAAIANIAPTPGGIGPLEAAMIAALSGFGLEAGAAISSVLTFRLATFWLPIVPGWFTFMWMERRGEI